MAKPSIKCPFCSRGIELNIKAEGTIPNEEKFWECSCGWKGPDYLLKRRAPPTCPQCGAIANLDYEATGIRKEKRSEGE